MIVLYLAAINIIAMAAMAADKKRAGSGSRRIPERTLFLLAALGGSAGAIAGMFIFRHKTRHLSFRIGLPAIFIVQCALVFLLRGYLSKA